MEFQVVCLVTRHVLFCMGHLGLEDFIPGTGEGIIKFLYKDLDCWKSGFQVECGWLCLVPAVIHKERGVAGTGITFDPYFQVDFKLICSSPHTE